MHRPEFVTFAASREQLVAAVESGADHVVLEDPRLSVQCYRFDEPQDKFANIKYLAKEARAIHPAIKLSFNCDLVVHQKHFPVIESLLQALPDCAIDTVRVSDIGAAHFIRERCPEMALHLISRMANNNQEALAFYAGSSLNIQRQILSNELSASDIKAITQNVSGEFEYQVHGPILLQYTHRRLMAGQQKEFGEAVSKQTILHKYAISEQSAHKEFPFYDTEHGHFMFFWADKSLLKHIDMLKDLGLTAWLIDARGQSEDYLRLALKAYQDAWGGKLSQETVTQLKAVSPRPYRSGFFKKNNTDAQLRKKQTGPKEQTIGVVLDVIKGSSVVVELREPLSEGDQLIFLRSDSAEIPYTVDHMEDLGYNLVQLPWKKGLIEQSVCTRAGSRSPIVVGDRLREDDKLL